MDVKVSEKEGVSVYEVSGEINIGTSPELRKYFDKQVSKKIVVDLAKVTYVDSSGLATLVEILKKTKSQSGSLGLSGMSDKVRSLFEITKLDKLFQLFPTQQEAVARVK